MLPVAQQSLVYALLVSIALLVPTILILCPQRPLALWARTVRWDLLLQSTALLVRIRIRPSNQVARRALPVTIVLQGRLPRQTVLLVSIALQTRLLPFRILVLKGRTLTRPTVSQCLSVYRVPLASIVQVWARLQRY